LIEEVGDGCGDADGREEGVRATVVAGGDAPPVFEFGEEVLDFVALAVERLFSSGALRLRRDGMQGSVSRTLSASRKPSLSYPLSTIIAS
jgi:hypothetical protein